jgi:hypothetical protein
LVTYFDEEAKAHGKSESNMPVDIKTTPEQEQTVQVAEDAAPEMSVEEAATLAHESEAVLHDIGDDGLEPPTPFDILAQATWLCYSLKSTIDHIKKQEAVQEVKSYHIIL